MVRLIQATVSGPFRLSTYSRRIQRIGMCGYGHEFFDLATKTRPSILRTYLVGHAFELYLKAFLLKTGKTVAELRSRPYGHDVHRLLLDSIAAGLGAHFTISQELVAEVQKFSVSYGGKSYEYFSFLDSC